VTRGRGPGQRGEGKLSEWLSKRELENPVDGAGDRAGRRNRTDMASLEGWSFTIKLYPRNRGLNHSSNEAKLFQPLDGETFAIMQRAEPFDRASRERKDYGGGRSGTSIKAWGQGLILRAPMVESPTDLLLQGHRGWPLIDEVAKKVPVLQMKTQADGCR